MNRLATATSPYLRQHADNPVDWYLWGDEAFERARAEDKMVFISIGYASCHWCHVMAHESFEDPITAADLARDFVAIKVDREERPDVDAIYMAATTAMSGHGGWPMSVFCTPDGRPFFAGTYYPNHSRGGLASFRQVLAALATAWRDDRSGIESQADALAQAVADDMALTTRLGPAEADHVDFGAALGQLVTEIAPRFDPHFGGFSPAPKFPRPALIDACLRQWLRTGDERARTMAVVTLDAMARGGIYDHLAGGFARYSVDGEWLVPHFEKMLTDQALLARCYLHGAQVLGDPSYRQVVHETLAFVDAELSLEGGFASGIDADAGGEEGSHATFTAAQLRSTLAGAGLEEHYDEVAAFYGVTESGNFEGTNILFRPLGAELARPPIIEAARRALLAQRRTRVQPALDDKVLTEWTAMMAATFLECGSALRQPSWVERGVRALDFLYDYLRRADGRWLRSWRDGVAANLAVAGDLAWVVEASTRAYEATGHGHWITRASEVADALLGNFFDGGVLYTTGHDAETLVVRPIDVLDGAIASSHSIAARALWRLGAIGGEARFTQGAEAIVNNVATVLERAPSAVADLLEAVGGLGAASELVIVNRPELVAAAQARWLPSTVLAHGDHVNALAWAGRSEPGAYLCHHYVCERPITDAATLIRALTALEVPSS